MPFKTYLKLERIDYIKKLRMVTARTEIFFKIKARYHNSKSIKLHFMSLTVPALMASSCVYSKKAFKGLFFTLAFTQVFTLHHLSHGLDFVFALLLAHSSNIALWFSEVVIICRFVLTSRPHFASRHLYIDYPNIVRYKGNNIMVNSFPFTFLSFFSFCFLLKY